MTRLPAKHDTGRRHLLIIPLAALFAVHPLMVHGCSCGHDFDFHLVSWMEAAKQFGHGNPYPHWAYSPAFNAGEPRFVFYPPLSWVLGALLGLLLTHLPGVSEAAGWNAVPIVFTWTALCASGFAMHRLSRAFASANAALLAALLYLVNPYMLFTAYERTAYAELLAAAWMPLLLLAILQEEINIPSIALPLALLWLTNAPAAVIGSYTLALLAALRVISEVRSLRQDQAVKTGLTSAAGATLGLALAAFYIVPAAYERRFVQIAMATVGGMRIDQNFLFAHTGKSADALLHDTVLHTASAVAVVMLLATAAAMAALSIRRSRNRAARDSNYQVALPLLSLMIVTAAIAVLLTRISSPIWKYAPEAAFLQFPWRLLSVLAPVCVLILAAALSRLRLNSQAMTIISIVFLIALTLPAYHLFQQRCYPGDTPPEQLELFHANGGVDPTDEYTPLTGDNDVLRTNDPPYWLASSPGAVASSGAVPGPAPAHLSVTAPNAEFLILNLRDYPAWRIVRNGVLEPIHQERDDGLIALPIPAGPSNIEIRYGRMADEIAGDIISVLALPTLLIIKRGTHASSRAVSST
ncbi:MAG TPA: hypothetical protein VGI23_10230 [Steroidobacteraceae bacterium]